jgi:hypothetical protein
MYNISSTAWTWVSGNSTVNAAGFYGVKGIASTSNYPAARYHSNMVFYPAGGALFLFGGYTGSRSFFSNSFRLPFFRRIQ